MLKCSFSEVNFNGNQERVTFMACNVARRLEKYDLCSPAHGRTATLCFWLLYDREKRVRKGVRHAASLPTGCSRYVRRVRSFIYFFCLTDKKKLRWNCWLRTGRVGAPVPALTSELSLKRPPHSHAKSQPIHKLVSSFTQSESRIQWLTLFV